MKATKSIPLVFLITHSLVPLWVFTNLAHITDGTERWGNTLKLYLLDLPLYPIFLWFENSQKIHDSSIINTWISLILGGLLYAGVGWLIGYCWEKRKMKKIQQGGGEVRS